ncbi:hypothetical protein [Kineococcus sp. SYSU DK005]|uniref:hypothetical protein n=1 Tax=Kineococcus sp. SYSU DK005 TaxID=3383126 RepID=UPI003D7D3275
MAAALAGTFSLLGVGIAGFLVLTGPQTDGPAPVAELRTRPSSSPSSPPAPATGGAPAPATASPAATPTATAVGGAPATP